MYFTFFNTTVFINNIKYSKIIKRYKATSFEYYM